MFLEGLAPEAGISRLVSYERRWIMHGKINLPCDKTTLIAQISPENFVGSMVSKVESYRPDKSPEELVEASLDLGRRGIT